MLIICCRCEKEESFCSMDAAVEAGWIKEMGWMNMGSYITKVKGGFSICGDCCTVYEAKRYELFVKQSQARLQLRLF